MKKLFLVLLVVITTRYAHAQYWQQEVNYKINVSLDDQKHTLRGFLDLEYINNSPDTLQFIWFHLWPNAYQNENTAYAKQVLRDKEEGRKRWKEMKDKGYIDSLQFRVNGQKALTEADRENIDVIKLLLPSPLLPGNRIGITTPFFVKIPTYSSRSGHMGQSYMICQWYPKPAVYDRKGWHPMPYLDQGEFYSEFGRFSVDITVPSSYVVGATGTLQNGEELTKYREIGAKNLLEKSFTKYSPVNSTATKTLGYEGQNIHDFAWFADKDFIIRYDTARLASGNVIDVFTFSQSNGNRNWSNSVGYVEDAIRKYSGWIGEYPYPVAQAVEGPRNAMSGGMEYPMITLITSPEATEEYLDAVITHEVGHNWFYGIIGSNERDHAWMDEGLNTYYQFRYEGEKYRGNSIFGNALPQDVRDRPLPEFFGMIYGALAELPMDEPIETPSAEFANKDQYAMVVYLKTSVWMYIIEVTLGAEKLDSVMQAYFEEWKFRHPYPEDLKREFESKLNVNMDGIFRLLDKKGKFE